MPNPNGYDEIVRAGIAASSNFWAYKSMGIDELRAALKTNAPAIAEGHQALKLECRVRLHWLPGPNDVDEEMAPVDLFDAFAAQARLAELENRPQDAMKCYLDIVWLGNQSSRGGLIANGLQGIGIESRGADYLEKLSAELEAKSCKEIMTTLESIDSQRETMAAYEREEKRLFQEHARGVRATLTWYYLEFYFRKNREKAEKTFARLLINIRQDTIRIAARAYKLDKGRAPTSTADLVPAYLKSVPADPTTGEPMALPR